MEVNLVCQAKESGCGGCPLLNLSYTEQLKKKQTLAKKHLSTFGKPKPIIGMEDPYHYRNKAIATYAMEKGELVSGIYREGSHRVVPVSNCLLHAPQTNEALAAVLNTARELNVKAYDEDRHTGVLRHALVRRGHTSGQMMVVLVTATGHLPAKEEFVKRLISKCPDIVTVVQNINPRQTSAVLGFVEHVLYGPGKIEDTLCGLKFLISSRSFYQVNSIQTEVLYNEAIRLADLKGDETIIDAYCGIGTLTLCAAQRAGQAIGIEVNPSAVTNAIRNVKNNHMDNADFIKGDAGLVMSDMAQMGKTADVVFMDPPRAGASEEFIWSVSALAPKKIVYISCNVETQARDLKLFHHRGYRVKAIQPVDMFPHTEHVECVVLLSRVEKQE